MKRPVAIAGWLTFCGGGEVIAPCVKRCSLRRTRQAAAIAPKKVQTTWATRLAYAVTRTDSLVQIPGV